MSNSISILWNKRQNLQIRDVHVKERERVKEYVKQHLLSNELFQILGYHKDEQFIKDLENVLQNVLENDCSVVVSDENSQEIQAVALVKWMSEDWHSWTALRFICDGQNLAEFIDFIRGCIEKHDVLNIQAKSDSLHLFYFHVAPEWMEDVCFMARFFQAICEVARHMHMPRVTYMAWSKMEQHIMEEAGFKELQRILYSMYMSKGRRPFDHLRDANEMFGSLYEKTVEPIIPFQQLKIRHNESEEFKNDK